MRTYTDKSRSTIPMLRANTTSTMTSYSDFRAAIDSLTHDMRHLLSNEPLNVMECGILTLNALVRRPYTVTAIDIERIDVIPIVEARRC